VRRERGRKGEGKWRGRGASAAGVLRRCRGIERDGESERRFFFAEARGRREIFRGDVARVFLATWSADGQVKEAAEVDQ